MEHANGENGVIGEELTRFETTGELPRNRALREVARRLDRYLQAIALVQRQRTAESNGVTDGERRVELTRVWGGRKWLTVSARWNPGRTGRRGWSAT